MEIKLLLAPAGISTAKSESAGAGAAPSGDGGDARYTSLKADGDGG
jgi:hypothetical protein